MKFLVSVLPMFIGFRRVRSADRAGAKQVYTRGQQKTGRPVRNQETHSSL